MRITEKSSCRCCNGSYAKVGRSANKHNAMRGLKKAARRASRSEIIDGLMEQEEIEWDRERWDDNAGDELQSYNFDLAYEFVEILGKIAPELTWCDNHRNNWNWEPRALGKLPYLMEKLAPVHEEIYNEILRKILGERP